MKPFIRSPYNYDTALASNEVAVKDSGERITDQSFKDDADINVLVRRFGVTGLASDVPLPPTIADFSAEVFDYQTSMNLIRAADESFQGLDARVRARFNNDPGQFVQYCSELDDDGKSLRNLAEMRKMGLAVPAKAPPPPPEPMNVRIIPEDDDGSKNGAPSSGGAKKGAKASSGPTPGAGQ